MSPAVTRRRIVQAAGAAIGAAAAGVAAPALARLAADPDAALFDLIARWPAARAAYDAAGDRTAPLYDLFVEQEPPRPEALHLRSFDRLGLGRCGYEVLIQPDGSYLRVYGFGEIGALTHPDYRPPAGSEARHAEVLAAHRAWMLECQAVKDRLGLRPLEDAEDDASAELGRVQDAILDALPATLAGLGAKARWATGSDKAPALRELWTERIAADAVAMAERDAPGGAS